MSIDRIEKEQITKSVGKRIQKCRQKAELSQKQLSEKSGISQKHISRIEQCYHDTHFTMIYKIAKALNVPIDAFAMDFEEDNSNIFLSIFVKLIAITSLVRFKIKETPKTLNFQGFRGFLVIIPTR